MAAHASPSLAALSFESGSSFVKAHAPLPQAPIGVTAPGIPELAFFGNGYETWVDNIREAPELTQAGAHPDLTISFQLQGTASEPDGVAKDLVTDLPAGAIADPLAVPRCEAADFHLTLSGHCPTESQVGTAASNSSVIQGLSPLDNLVPPPGDAMMLGFKSFGFTVVLHTSVRTFGDYGLRGEVTDLATLSQPRGSTLTLWGVPYDGLHDSHRFDTSSGELGAEVTGTAIRPFTSAPTSCDSDPIQTELNVRSWGNAEQWITEHLTAPGETGCEQIPFDPEVTARPTTTLADSPTGLRVDVGLSHDEECETLPPPESGETREQWIAEGRSTESCPLQTSHLKDTRITLPKGMALNPAGGNGLDGCSPSEIGLTTTLGFKPIRFTAEPGGCPDASKIGTAEVETPMLEAPLSGVLYLADPYDNPFESLLAIYIEVDEPQRGIVAKFAGHVEIDPSSGLLVITVNGGPQLPIQRIGLDLRQGPHALLRTPPICGEFRTESELTPYATPSSPVDLEDSFAVESSPQGGCGRPSPRSLDAGTISPIAAGYSPFVLSLRRPDGSEEFHSVALSLPPGLTAKLAGIRSCPSTALVAAVHRGGSEESANPSCPADSDVGDVWVGAGAGPSPYYMRGDAYLAGPFKGAPFSLAFVTPVIAGPFDLGTEVTRAALHVDPETARVTAQIDSLPSAVRGVVLDVRSIEVRLDRHEFTLNPTSCDPTSVDAAIISASGAATAVSSRFQLAECRALGLKYRVRLRLTGGVRRHGHPALRAVVTPRDRGANLRRLAVAVPRGMLIDLLHLRAICNPEQFIAESCPAPAAIGLATVWSPLLDRPLQGRVILVETSGRYPGLGVELHGQVDMLLRGAVSARRGKVRIVFDHLPDVPISRVRLDLAGGKRGLVVNSNGLCARPQRAGVTLVSQGGAHRWFGTRISVPCGSGGTSQPRVSASPCSRRSRWRTPSRLPRRRSSCERG
jgi:hypothetical protein